jgi:6-phosphofructokinase 2
MAQIVTITVNPSIDLSASVDRVTPFRKLRCSQVSRDPGGGGINVARVIKRMGADVVAVYPAGGALGELLRLLVDHEHIRALTIPISEETRQDFTVLENESGKQYRFILPGPQLSEQEWRAVLDALATVDKGDIRFVVASGSLPPGVPTDFYAQIACAAKRERKKLIVDSSGPPLRAALEVGVYLIKPNLREFRELAGHPLEIERDWITAARDLVKDSKVEVVALSLGAEGALLVTKDRVLRAKAVPIKPVSVVGAGDSFLGAMVWGIAGGRDLEMALRYGVAAGTASLMAAGTQLCKREDVERLIDQVEILTL